MQRIDIDSLDHPGLRDYVNLTDVALRRVLEPEGGLYMAESSKVISRALAAGHRPRSVLTQPKFLPQVEHLLVAHPATPVFVGSEALLEDLTGYRMHRGMMASMHRPALPDARELLSQTKTALVLDGIVDHTNVGAAFRNAAALGADAVFVTESCADPLYRRSVRVSMGTVLQIPWTRLPAWPSASQLFADAGVSLAALALDDRAVTLRSFARNRPDRVALVLGTEGHGLDASALRAAEHTVMIPMQHGVDSLNVAATSAVALYALIDAAE
ncbi:TrmH family RNA methyltransferase [Gulosibacter bifidus]|uniref:TrmH family RNA methyltransferase n=1 Tax=Gulosibacter bifidus TaxID=272239 RepID=A0ABW5RH30_9MICO|nr:RNA methyltransferase [Gulosibacter bifidus]